MDKQDWFINNNLDPDSVIYRELSQLKHNILTSNYNLRHYPVNNTVRLKLEEILNRSLGYYDRVENAAFLKDVVFSYQDIEAIESYLDYLRL